MRSNTFILMLALLLCGSILAGENPAAGQSPEPKSDRLRLEEILPKNTLVCARGFNPEKLPESFKASALGAACDNPEVADFLIQLEMNKAAFISNLSARAKLDPASLEELLRARPSFALVDIGASARWCVGLECPPDFDSAQVFNCIKALTQRGIDIEIPSSAETIEGADTLVLLMPEEHFFVFIKNLLIYTSNRALAAELVRNASAKNAPTLAGNPLFKATKANVMPLSPGGTFVFVNAGPLYRLLALVADQKTFRLLEIMGMQSVQAIGISCGFKGEGICHNIYFHAPGRRTGLLEILALGGGAETSLSGVPDDAWFCLGARLNIANLYAQIPALHDAINDATGLSAYSRMAVLAQKQDILGVPAVEVAAALGDSFTVWSGPSGTALRFDSADIAKFQELAKRMEKSSGHAFSEIADPQSNVIIRYLNQPAASMPVVPSYAIVGNSIYLGTHTQVLKSAFRHQKNKQILNANPDFKRAAAGFDKDLGLAMYMDCGDSYTHVYDAILPFTNILAGRLAAGLDPGMLPPGEELRKYFFGFSACIRNSQQGITVSAYSPLGLGGHLVFLLDKLVVSNPVGMGVAAAWFGKFTSPTALQPEPTPAK